METKRTLAYISGCCRVHTSFGRLDLRPNRLMGRILRLTAHTQALPLVPWDINSRLASNTGSPTAVAFSECSVSARVVHFFSPLSSSFVGKKTTPGTYQRFILFVYKQIAITSQAIMGFSCTQHTPLT